MPDEHATPKKSRAMRDTWRRYKRNPGAVFGLMLIALVVVISVSAPFIYPHSPFKMVAKPYELPFGSFVLGTDTLGRNVAAGIAHGARVSLMIGLLATLIAVVAGTMIGGLAGYYGSWVDDVLMRITELFQTIPSFIFAIVLIGIMSPSLESVIIAIAVVTWPPVARLVRGEFLALRSREFVQACIGLGMTDARIILTQMLPNSLSPIIVISSLMVSTAILFESGLSFLGLGDPNVMSWGFMIGSGRDVLRIAWWVCTFPGIAILVTVLALNLIGDGLNDALNPRLMGR
jgi:peptide/nickel transport system permease protein